MRMTSIMNRATPYLFLAPAGIVLVFALLYPIGYLTVASFFDWRMGTPFADAVYAGSQKCLSCVPGIAPVPTVARVLMPIGQALTPWTSDALLAARVALAMAGVRPGHEVITTPYTFDATMESIILLDAVPVFVDIRGEDLNIDPARIEAAITPNTVAFLVEPIQGEAGVIIPPQGYLQAARDICSRRNVVLVLDEIQTGLGRTGRMFASEYSGVEPDLITMAKGIAGGFPIAAVVGKAEIMDHIAPVGDVYQAGTLSGNPLATIAGLTRRSFN